MQASRHFPSSSLTLILVLAVAALGACSGPQTQTETTMFAWAGALKAHLTTDRDANFEMPERLMDIKPELREGMPDPVDGWGNDLYYRKWIDDHYDLISAGPDGQFGNDDDVIVMNGQLKKPADIYAERPYREER